MMTQLSDELIKYEERRSEWIATWETRQERIEKYLNSEETLVKIDAMLLSHDQEMKMLGMRLFYASFDVWECDINLNEFWWGHLYRTKARVNVLRKEIKKQKDEKSNRRNDTRSL